MLIARQTLDRGRFFVEQAVRVGLDDRQVFQHFLEAAIIFGRSVTFHLQKELAHEDGFGDWYAEWQAQLGQISVCVFLLEKRNFLLKEGPTKISAVHEMSGSCSVVVSCHAEATVVRAMPWYRRSPKILWADLIAPLKSWIHHHKKPKVMGVRFSFEVPHSYD